jgi:replication factor C subunit 3/5
MTLSSNYHIELNPSDAEHNDRHVIQNIIKEIAMSPPLEATKTNFKGNCHAKN